MAFGRLIGAEVGPSINGPAIAAETVTPKTAVIAAALNMLFRRIFVLDLHSGLLYWMDSPSLSMGDSWAETL